MTYYLLRWGTGDGCDYTIGCNERITKLKATTPEEARNEADKILMPEEPEWWDASRERESDYIKKAIIVNSVMDIRVEDIYDTCREIAANRIRGEKEAEERKEFERLKKKFE